VRDFPQNLELEDVKMAAFVRDLPQNQVQTVKMKPELSELSVPMRGRSDHDPGTYPSSEARFVLQNTEFRIR
jgi:hypothetical protein